MSARLTGRLSARLPVVGSVDALCSCYCHRESGQEVGGGQEVGSGQEVGGGQEVGSGQEVCGGRAGGSYEDAWFSKCFNTSRRIKHKHNNLQINSQAK